MKMKSNLTTGRVPDIVTFIIVWIGMVMARMVMMVKTSMRWIMKWVRLR